MPGPMPPIVLPLAGLAKEAAWPKEFDRLVGCSRHRQIRENLAENACKFESMTRARRGKNDLGSARVQAQHKMLISAACVDAHVCPADTACSRRDEATHHACEMHLLFVRYLGPNLVRSRQIAAG